MDKLLLIILIILGLAAPTVAGAPPQQLPQQLQSRINGAIAAFTHHPLVQRLLPGIEQRVPNSSSEVSTPEPLVAQTGSDIFVNNIYIGQTFFEIRNAHPDFPAAGVIEPSPTGENNNVIDYKGARYFFERNTLVGISVPRTPELLHTGMPLETARIRYGEPVRGFGLGDGRTFAVFPALPDRDLAWVMQYNDMTITQIHLRPGLASYIADGK